MIIQCQTCRARFRLDDSRITGQGVRVRCRKCGDSIVVLRPEAGPSDQPPAGREANSLDLRSLIRIPAAGASPDGTTPGTASPPASPLPPDEVDAAFEQLLAGTVKMKPAPPASPGAKDRPPLLDSYELPREGTAGEDTAGGAAGPPGDGDTHSGNNDGTPPRESSVPGSPGGNRPDFHVDFAPEEKLTFAFEPESSDSLRGERAGGSDRNYDIAASLRSAPAPGWGAAPAPPDGPPESPTGRAETFHEELATMQGFEAPPSPSYSVPPSPEPKAVEETPPRKPEAAYKSPVFQAGTRRPAASRSRSPVGLLIVLFVILAGGGGYLSFTPDGQKTLSWLVVKATVLWTGAEPVASGYDVNNLIGYYETNLEVGRMFIIKGQVVNAGRSHKSGIRIQATLLDAGTREVAGKTVYAGNVLGGDELRRASREKIEASMTNRFGRNLVNIDIAPGKPIPFMVVFFGAPEGIDAYRIEARDGD